MRRMVRNKQTVYMSTFKSKAAMKDSLGNETGEYQITYNAPVKKSWNVSLVESDAEVAMFGIDSKNTIRIVADPMTLDESSILWYGKTPATPFVATAPGHNYIIVGVRPSLNELVFYAQKANVT